jgi:hypothetical protein
MNLVAQRLRCFVSLRMTGLNACEVCVKSPFALYCEAMRHKSTQLRDFMFTSSCIPLCERARRKRHPFQQHFRFSTAQKEWIPVGLGTLLRQRETVRLRVLSQPNGAGSRQERCAWVKRSRSIHDAPCPARWARTGTLSMCPDASDCEAKAAHLARYAELRGSLDASLWCLTGGD